MAYVKPEEFKQFQLSIEPVVNETPIVPIGSGIVLKTGDFMSPNYRKGQSGWMINSKGDAELNSLEVRQVSSLVTSFIAGENIIADDADPVPICIGNGGADTQLDITAAGSPDGFGEAAAGANVKIAQSFQETVAMTINQIKLRLAAVGSPTDNLDFTLETDNAGDPSGTVLATGTIAGTSLGAMAQVTITLNTTVTLSANTKYWVVMVRDGSASDTDHYSNDGSIASTYANGSAKRTINTAPTTWVAHNNADIDLELDLVLSTTNIYISDANSSTRNRFLGFVTETVSRGDEINIVLNGVVETFVTALIVGSAYYVQDTIGTIGTVPGTTSLPVGTAISSSQLLLDRT